MRTHKTVAISLPLEMLSEARSRAASLGFANSFSAYLQHLVRADLERNGPPPVVKDAATTYKTSTEAELGKLLKRLLEQNEPTTNKGVDS